MDRGSGATQVARPTAKPVVAVALSSLWNLLISPCQYDSHDIHASYEMVNGRFILPHNPCIVSVSHQSKRWTVQRKIHVAGDAPRIRQIRQE